MERAELELKAAAALELKRRKSNRRTIVGVVHPDQGHIKNISQQKNGEWIDLPAGEADFYIAAKMEMVFKSKKRFIVVIGGRGSTKSVGVADLAIADAKDNGNKTYFLREYQASIKNSVHSLIKDEIKRFGFCGFNVQQQSIGYKEDQAFEFAGLARNIDSVKSTHGFKRFAVEEAQFISQASLDALTPTIREKPNNGLPKKFQADRPSDELLEDIKETASTSGVSIVFIANPGSSEDPFSKRFIMPFKAELDRNGYYEDELHFVIVINYQDNPWFDDSGLEQERLWDYENRSRAYYDHRWNGGFNDEVEDSIIKAEWFDAAIDAHVKLGFKPRGQKICTHDPADSGDAKAVLIRHGSVILHAEENTKDDVNDAFDWATNFCIEHKCDSFRWDTGGMGISLKRQADENFRNKGINYELFNGAEGVDDPKEIYQPNYESIYKEKKNEEIFTNKRSHRYWQLRDKFYNTYRAVTKNEYHDPLDLISISSKISCIQKLRSELCRIPLKDPHRGMIQIMRKDEMLRKHKIQSPNLADCAMMSERFVKIETNPDFLQPMPVRRVV